MSARAEQPLVRVDRLTKVYRTDSVETHAVCEVSIDIAAGEYVVLRGPSGCGKSTLLSMLGLLERPTSGSIEIGGHDAASLSETERARVRGLYLGFVFQAFQLIPRLSVRANVELPLHLHRKLSAVERRDRVDTALKAVGMEHRADHYPGQLSGGQQQRVAIARAIVGQPKLVLADEPTGNLDSASGDGVMGLLAELHRNGTTICLVTHDPRYANAGTRGLDLADGRVVGDTSGQGICS